MKIKVLLFIGLFAFLNVNAQNLKLPERASVIPANPVEENLEPSSSATGTPVSPVIHRTTTKNSANAISVITIGGAPNGVTCAQRSRSNINYNKDLNTVVVIHRGTIPPAANSGYYYYDISTDGGNAWTTNRGPVYSSNSTVSARFPLGDIYNPPGNTNLANAYMVSNGPFTNSAGGWGGHVRGDGKLSNTGVTQSFDSSKAGFMYNEFVTKGGNAWRIGLDYTNSSAAQSYAGTLHLGKGTFNPTTSNFQYINAHFPCPAAPIFNTVTDMNVVFADDNLTGYIAVLTTNASNTCIPDTALYFTVYKTTDGGAHWSSNIDLGFQHAVDALLANNGSTYGPAFNFDMVVDANKNLHINAALYPQKGLTITATSGLWGMFDIYTTDQGTTWKAELLGKPQTYGASFGAATPANPTVVEYSRPFASRTTDGTKLFFGWFDTDTLLFTGVGNSQPNLFIKAFDVTTCKWTSTLNMTAGTDADGLVTFGNGSYYVVENGGSYTIPVFFLALVDPMSTGSVSQLNYINGATITDADFTINCNPVTFSKLACAPVQTPFVSLTMDVENIIDSQHLTVSGNYPNPFTGFTTIDVYSPTTGDLTIEISNNLGQILITNEYKRLAAGRNEITIDCSKLAKGMYVYKVRAGEEIVTRTLVVM